MRLIWESLSPWKCLIFFFSPPPPTSSVISTLISICMIGDATCPGSSTDFDMVLSQNHDAVSILNTLDWFKREQKRRRSLVWKRRQRADNYLHLLASSRFTQKKHTDQYLYGRWTDNAEEWTGKPLAETQALAHDGNRWRRLVHSQTPSTGLRHPSFNHCRI